MMYPQPMSRIMIAIAILALASCATVQRFDRGGVTKFEMVSDSSWRMTAGTSVTYPPESDKAEAVRMKWLSEHTAANGCASFEVASRVWTKATSALTESTGTLAYTGTCSR